MLISDGGKKSIYLCIFVKTSFKSHLSIKIHGDLKYTAIAKEYI